MAQFFTPHTQTLNKKIMTVTIHSVDAFGQGVTNDTGKTTFVIDALPEEKVDIQLIEDKKNYAKAKVIKRYNSSEFRVEPPCHHYSVCGGCQMQHLSLSLQQQSKKNAFVRLIERETKSLIPLPTLIESANYHYRRRSRIAVIVSKNQLLMGFRQLSSNKIVTLKHCPILVDTLDMLLQPIYQCLVELKQKTHLGHIELIAADNTTILLIRQLAVFCYEDQQLLENFAKQHKLTLFLQSQQNELIQLTGQTPYYMANNLMLKFSPLNFIQINKNVNQKMIDQAIEWLETAPTDCVLDLFCGMGNFSLPLAKKVRQVVGIEGVDQLVSKAQENAEQNQIKNVQFYVGDLENYFEQQVLAFQANKVLLDPSRAGALTVMSYLVKLAPTHIVYISCHPATLARDSRILIEHGYRIDKVSMIDMFPQTKHLESMILFRK